MTVEKKKSPLTFLNTFDLPTCLFLGALVIYLATRLIGLDRFPIYFFTDEANQTQSIATLVENNYRLDDVVLPTYFPNGPYYNLGLSVYLQWLPYLLFGKSAVVTRITSILITLIAAISVGLILRDIFKLKYWWAGTLFLSITPAWFLHSRTAFETVEFVAFYSGAIYAYLLYRYRSPRYLYMALFLISCAFYTYSPAQLIVPLTAAALLLSDWKYHQQNRSTALRGMALSFIFIIPYLRFIFYNPHIPLMHLNTLGSYWMANISFIEKLRHYLSEYGVGLSPWYWYTPNTRDLPRHLMKGYGHIALFTLPFAALGLASMLRDLRASANRTILMILLLSPSAAALVGTGITRALIFVIPACILTTIGFEITIKWLINQHNRQTFVALCTFILLSSANIWMLYDSLKNGPTWYSDYGLGGMQYGGFQIFDIVREYSQEHPEAKVFLSPDWSNGTDVLFSFFLGKPSSIWLWSIRGHINQKLPLDETMVFVITSDEYALVQENPKFSTVHVIKTVPYPNGEPGFYFVQLLYSKDIETILASETAARQELEETTLTINGEDVELHYSKLDSDVPEKAIANLFDGDPLTFAKTAEANPFVVELTYPTPINIHEFSIVIGSTRASITLTMYPYKGAQPMIYTFTGRGSISNPILIFKLPAPTTAQILRIEFLEFGKREPTLVHIWEITFR